MVGQGRGNRSGLGASGGANLVPGGAGSRCWRYGVTCPRRLALHPSVPSPNRFDLSGSREARVTTRSPRYIGCPAFEQPRCATKAPAASEGAVSVTEHKPRLAAVGEAADAHTQLEAALFEIKRVIVGQEGMLERVLVALLSNGHLLLEGVPGLAKTLTISTVAKVLGGTFHRVQFTPDLVPSDLVGTRIYRPDSGEFDTELGPVFCNFLLADEINRAPAKVQSALLEVMQEHQVTIGHETHYVPDPFLVMATQNPIESEGTYPLPEAQVDRFMLKILVDYPHHDEELTVVHRSLAVAPELPQVLSIDELRGLQQTVDHIYV